MTDPETTTTLTAVATMYGIPFFTETLKFLYAQATEVLKARRDRKKAVESGSIQEPQISATTPKELPDIFEGRIDPLIIDFDTLEPVGDVLSDLWKDISAYAQGIEDIDPENLEMQAKLEALRRLLEAVYSQRITFKGEQRESSGLLVRGSIDVKEVAGYAAAVRAELVTGGSVIGHAAVERVSPGGHLVGTEVDTIKPDK